MPKHIAVIGGGHNGLVAANYLARAGHRVTLIEARGSLGGPAGRFEYLPGYSSSLTNSIGSFESRIFDELQLESFGLRFHKPEVTLLHPVDNGLFIGWRDRDRVAAQMDAYAPGEAERHRRLIETLDRLGKASGLSLWDRPEADEAFLDEMDPAEREEFQRLILDGSLMELLDETLQSPQVKSMMMMLALNGQLISPRERGSAFGLLLRPISRAHGDGGLLGNQDAALRGSVGLPIGSMGSIIDALTLSAHALGVNIRLNSRATKILFDDHGVVESIELDSGITIQGIDAAVSAIEPSLLADLIGDLPRDESEWPQRPQGSAFKIALALDGIPQAHAPDVGIPDETLLQAQFRIGPNPDYIEQAVHDGIAGRASSAPIIWGLIPTLASPGLAPPGKHLLSLNVWHAPYSLGRDYWTDHGEAYVAATLREVQRLMPHLDQHIEDVSWYSPHDIEDEFSMTASNITHGDMTPEQMFHDRPAPGLPRFLTQHGIYLGGAGTWPGGYVTGAPGRNAATSIIQDMETPQ